MNPRENLLSLLKRQGYESVPVFFEITPPLWEGFKKMTEAEGRKGVGIEEYYGPELFPLALVDEPEFAERGQVDWRQYYPDDLKPGATFDADFGVAREPGSEAAKGFTHIRYPMAGFDSVEQAKAYPWPDWSGADWRKAGRQVDAIHARGKAAYGFMQMTVWEKAWHMRGMENIMPEMLEEDEMAVYIFDKVTETACQRARYYARAGADLLFIGDDVGMQHSTMMSRDMYREWIMPRMRKVIDAAKAEHPGIIVDYHTCGYVAPFIDDFIEGGVEVLNPVQPETMDFREVHGAYGDRLSFRGAIGTQVCMPYDDPKDVKKAVWRVLDIAGPKGGLFASPAHILNPEVPWTNITAYVEACREYSVAGR